LEQVFAQNYLEYFERIRKRGLSALAMIPDEEFDGIKEAAHGTLGAGHLPDIMEVLY
jgi:hypothetical protein